MLGIDGPVSIYIWVTVSIYDMVFGWIRLDVYLLKPNLKLSRALGLPSASTIDLRLGPALVV